MPQLRMALSQQFPFYSCSKSVWCSSAIQLTIADRPSADLACSKQPEAAHHLVSAHHNRQLQHRRGRDGREAAERLQREHERRLDRRDLAAPTRKQLQSADIQCKPSIVITSDHVLGGPICWQ